MAIVLIFDCGATNTRTIAINEKGEILASHHKPSETKACPDNPHYHYWDFESIWYKLQHCCEQTLIKLKDLGHNLGEVKGISVTTFGVDGAPFDKDGHQLYPIISWKCPRTIPVMKRLGDYLDVEALYHRNGIGQYSFNTLFKLLWLKEHQAEIFNQMDKWLFISAMISFRLSGQMVSDRTMAGTSMMTNLATGDWDQDVLDVLGLSKDHFPPMKNPGEQIGTLLPLLAKKWGLEPIPVFSCGHDTQFAVFGSGAKLNQAVLSSGTWEILMARSAKAEPNSQFVANGLTIELDAQHGNFNPAVQWVSSGVMEWLGKLLFSDVVNSEHYYSTMIKEGSLVPAGSNGVRFKDNFTVADNSTGEILGLSMYKSRGEIYRAALEYMASQLKQGFKVLKQVSHLQADSLLCVGGGSKNKLWNQIRADMLNMPIDVVDVAESTVLGAAMFTFLACGVYPDVETAQQQMAAKRQRIYPSEDANFYANWN